MDLDGSTRMDCGCCFIHSQFPVFTLMIQHQEEKTIHLDSRLQKT